MMFGFGAVSVFDLTNEPILFLNIDPMKNCAVVRSNEDHRNGPGFRVHCKTLVIPG